MSKCTWVDCSEEAIHPHYGKDGSIWADLCGPHHTKFETDLDGFITGGSGPAKMMAAYVKANGGAKRLADKMVGR